MKRVSTLLVCLLSVMLTVPAQAHGFGRVGGYGYRGGWSHNWVGPALGAAIVGGAIYAASTPRYVIPQTVVIPQQYPPSNRVAFFCPTSQQFYPNVPTCQVPWQQTSY